MMKLQHPRSILALPLLLAAAPPQAHAQVLAAATSGALAEAAAPAALALADPALAAAVGAPAGTSAVGAWENVLARRHRARQLSRREQWVSAASQWREVLFELQQIERLEPRPAPFKTRGPMLKQEAEREMKSAQSHLGAFWRVRDMVTPGADSRNPAPILGPRPADTQRLALGSTLDPSTATGLAGARRVEPQAAPQDVPMVFSSALVRQPQPKATQKATQRAARANGARIGAGRADARAQDRRPWAHAAHGVAKASRGQKPSGEPASLRWAHAQWWARPMVRVGTDSRNSTPPYSAPGKAPLAAPRLVIAPGGDYRSAALVKALTAPAQLSTAPVARRVAATPVAVRVVPEPGVGASRGGAAPARARQSWTMQIRLPSASEAAQAAGRPLGS